MVDFAAARRGVVESRRAKEARVSVKKNFYSDNVSGAAPEILEAIVAANAGDSAPYGADPCTERLPERFAELFETEVEVYPVGTGTAANGLCASIIAAPYGAIYVSDAAHVHGSECGGAEFWSGGNARTVPLPAVDGKIAAADLARAVDEAGARSADVPPRAVSLTQATEVSTVYTPAEVKSIAEAAHARHLWVHMDGARFANAVARLGCTPAEASWKAGVDVLSFGATKNGALAAEAVVFFDRALAETMRYRRRRGGHLFSKMRFSPLSSRPSSPRTSGCGTPATPMPWPSGFVRAWPRSPACGSGARPRSTSSSSPCRRPSGTGSWPRATASPGAARPARASSGSPAPSTRGKRTSTPCWRPPTGTRALERGPTVRPPP